MSMHIRALTRHLTDDAMVEKITELRSEEPPAGVTPEFAQSLANGLEAELAQRCAVHLEMFELT